MPIRTYDPLSSHITRAHPPSPLPATRPVLPRGRPATGPPACPAPGPRRPGRRPSVWRPTRNTRAKPGTTTHPDRVGAARPPTIPRRSGPPGSAHPADRCADTRCRSGWDLCRDLPVGALGGAPGRGRRPRVGPDRRGHLVLGGRGPLTVGSGCPGRPLDPFGTLGPLGRRDGGAAL